MWAWFCGFRRADPAGASGLKTGWIGDPARVRAEGRRAVFAKLAAVILATGVIGCGLLALRQQRLQAAHELTQAQLRIRQLDEKLWAVRARIAYEVTPARVERLASGFGELRPMIAHPKRPTGPEQKLAGVDANHGGPLKPTADGPGGGRR